MILFSAWDFVMTIIGHVLLYVLGAFIIGSTIAAIAHRTREMVQHD